MHVSFEIGFIIALALVFDFINGFHDAANSIATVVSTRVLSPRIAVVWAAFFNFAAFKFFGVHVAKTVSKVVDPAFVTPEIILAGVAAAVIWNLITWWLGLPTSSSHALIGGYAGAALAAVGIRAVNTGEIATILKFIVLSPVIGFALGFFNMGVMLWIVRRWARQSADRFFRRLQLVSAAAFSLGHGGNDAQKTVGIITVLLYSSGYLTGTGFKVPNWVMFSSFGAIALGTMVGGWRIVETMGMRITKLQPVGGFCAETAGALTLFGVTLSGIPVSTTHTITGAIVGVGSTRRLSAVKWGVAGRIIWAWVLTMPIAALIAALVWYLLHLAGKA